MVITKILLMIATFVFYGLHYLRRIPTIDYIAP